MNLYSFDNISYVFTLVILAYNEENFIRDTVLKYVNIFEKILIVDDFSKDQTLDICKKLTKEYKNIELIENTKNLGAGYSFSLAIQQFLQSDTDYLIKIDGDDQFKYDDITVLKNIAVNQNPDFIKCDRFWENGIEGKIPLIRYFGNAFASVLLKFSTGNWKINDPLNGLFLFSKKSLQNFKLPKLFYRYGYPFFISTYLSNISIERKLKIIQVKNTVSYKGEKSNLNALTMFFKLIYFTISVFFNKIKTKLQYSALQTSALIDVLAVISLIVSIFSLVRFFMIRYGSLIASQANWFLVFVIFFFTFIYLIYQSQKIESEQKLEYFQEL